MHKSLPEVKYRKNLARRKPCAQVSQTMLYIMTIDEIPGVYKVGRTSDIQKRRQELNKGHFFRVTIVAEYPDCGHFELSIQDRLYPYLIKREGNGTREWFKTTIEHIRDTIQFVINSNSASSSSDHAAPP